MTSVFVLRMRSYAVQGSILRAALAVSGSSAGSSNNGASTNTTFTVGLARRYSFSMQGTGPEVLGVPKYPYPRRLLASPPVARVED